MDLSMKLEQAREAGRAFVAANLPALAAEVLQWKETSLLPDGRLRELARILEPLDAGNPLMLAESFVSLQSMATVVTVAASAQLPHAHGSDTALCVGNLLYALSRWKGSKPGDLAAWEALAAACSNLAEAARPGRGVPERLRAALALAQLALAEAEEFALVDATTDRWERVSNLCRAAAKALASFDIPWRLSDPEIDEICEPGRAKRWTGDGRQYDRDTVRLVLTTLANRSAELTTETGAAV